MTIQNVSLLPLDVCCTKYRSVRHWAAAGCGVKTMAAVAFLSGVLWSPPSLGQEWVQSKAQWGSPNASFLLSNSQRSTAGAIDENTILREGTLHIVGENALGLHTNALLAYQGTTVSYADGATLFNQMHLRGDNSAAEDGSTVPASWALADSVQWRVDTGVATQAGNMVGSIPVVKQGQGTLRYTGIASFPSFVTVNEGTLEVAWHLAGRVRVNHGARLEGSGTVRQATILDGGVLSPGRGLGHTAAFTVTEKLEFQPGAVFEVDVAATGLADSVLVVGPALLDGHVAARAGQGEWQTSTRYSLVQATEGFDGTRFASVGSNLAFLTPTLSYDANTVYLRLDRNGTPLEEVAETPTEDEVAEVIDEDDSGQKDNDELHDQIVVMDPPQASTAFNQLSGSWTASLLSGMVEDSRFVREAVLQNAGTSPSWSHAFYSSAQRSSEGGTPADARDIGGLVLGMERPITDNLRLGAFLGVQQSHQWRRLTMADAKIQSAHAGANLAARVLDIDLILGMARTWHKIQSHRKIGVAGLHDALSGNFRGRTMQFFGEVVAPFRWLGNLLKSASLRASPFVRVAWVQTHTNGFVEAGGAAATNVLPARQSLLFSTIGLRAVHALETPSGTAQLQGQVAWHYAGGDVRAFSHQSFRDSARQTVFESEGLSVARRAWSIDLAMQGQLTKAVSLGVAYAGRYSAGRQDHGARANVRWVF